MKYICALIITVLFTFCNMPDSNEEDQFTWDFSTDRKYIYSFNQKSTVIFDDIAKGYKDETPMDMTAKLNISVKDEQYAVLSLTEVMISKKNTLDTMDEFIESPSMVIQDMDSKGKFKTENQNMLFKLMLPLPSKHLRVGESDFTELEVPFTTNGSVLFSKGGTTLTYVKDTIVDGQSLALMAAVTDISDIDIPEELTGTYKMSTSGSSQFLFDKEKGCFKNAHVEFKMESYTKYDTPTENQYLALNDRMVMDAIVDIDLIEIEE